MNEFSGQRGVASVNIVTMDFNPLKEKSDKDESENHRFGTYFSKGLKLIRKKSVQD